MPRAIDLRIRAFEVLLVLLLAGMVVMVLGNVVMREHFDAGIDRSEALSRYFFIWLTFIVAVVEARENAHLGVETLVVKLGPGGRRLCMILSDLFILLCCAVFFWGTWQQAGINATNYAPITGISMLWVYGVGFFTSLGIGAMALIRLVHLLTGRISPEDLQAFAGELDRDDAHSLKGRLE